MVLEIGGYFRAEGAKPGGGSGAEPPEKLVEGHAHFPLGNAHFLSEELFPTSYLFLFLCSFFQIETFGMKELSTINAKKVLNSKPVTAYL